MGKLKIYLHLLKIHSEFERKIMNSNLALRIFSKSTIDLYRRSCLFSSRRSVATYQPPQARRSIVHPLSAYYFRTSANQISHAGSAVPSRSFHLSATTFGSRSHYETWHYVFFGSRSHYETLGVSPMATQREVKDAFDRLSAELHPDKNPSSPDAAEKFKAVTAAYDILGSPVKRSRYDGELAKSPGLGIIIFLVGLVDLIIILAPVALFLYLTCVFLVKGIELL